MPTYNGPSIVDFLSSNGMDSSFEARARLAQQYGVQPYPRANNAAENTALLRKLKAAAAAGTLRAPETQNTQGPSVPPAGGVNPLQTQDWGDYYAKTFMGRPATPEEKNRLSHLSDADRGLAEKYFSDLKASEAKAAEDRAAAEAEATQRNVRQPADGAGNFKLLGDVHLVQFQDDPTPNDGVDERNMLFLFNNKDKTYTPFVNSQAYQSFFDGKASDFDPKIELLTSSAFNNPTWKGTIRPMSQGIQPDGTVPNQPNFKRDLLAPAPVSDEILQQRYGVPRYDPTVEVPWVNAYDTTFSELLKRGGIDQASYDKFFASPDQAKYLNAYMYGGYTINDVWADWKAKELAAQGQNQYAGANIVNASVPKDTWQTNDAYKNYATDYKLQAPYDVAKMLPALFSSPIMRYPPGAFQSLVPNRDRESPEFKAEAEKIQAAYYDIMMQKASADTEQAKAIADDNYKRFSELIDKKYGVQLSNNARTAWGQLQGIFSGASEKGLMNSGIMNEAQDKYLSDVRRSDQILRDTKASEEDQRKRDELIQYGTPQQIAEFARQNPDKAKAWGLTPSDEQKSYWTMENLRSKYSDKSEAELKAMLDMVVDENGNYRSSLYKQMYGNKEQLGRDKLSYQKDQLMNQRALEEKRISDSLSVQPNNLSSYNSITDRLGGEKTVRSSDPNKLPPASNPTVNQNRGTSGTMNNNPMQDSARAAGEINSSGPTQTPSQTSQPRNQFGDVGYSGVSIVDYLSKAGYRDTSQAARSRLASEQGISNYDYSASKNTELLRKLRGF